MEDLETDPDPNSEDETKRQMLTWKYWGFGEGDDVQAFALYGLYMSLRFYVGLLWSVWGSLCTYIFTDRPLSMMVRCPCP